MSVVFQEELVKSIVLMALLLSRNYVTNYVTEALETKSFSQGPSSVRSNTRRRKTKLNDHDILIAL